MNIEPGPVQLKLVCFVLYRLHELSVSSPCMSQYIQYTCTTAFDPFNKSSICIHQGLSIFTFFKIHVIKLGQYWGFIFADIFKNVYKQGKKGNGSTVIVNRNLFIGILELASID